MYNNLWVFLRRQRRRPDDGALRPDRRQVGARRPAAPAPRGATSARLPIARLPQLTPVVVVVVVVVAVEALSRCEGDGVLAVPLLAATLKFIRHS